MTVRIGAVGDSNGVSGGQGGAVVTWPYRMLSRIAAAHPSQSYTMTNASRAGWGLAYFIDGLGGESLQTLCLQYDPHIVVVMLGTNDTYDTLANYTSRLNTIVGLIRAHTNADGTVPKVVLMQPPIAMDAVYGTRSGYTGFISNPYASGNPYTIGRPKVTMTHAAMSGGNPLAENAGGLTEFKNAVSAVGASLGVPVGATWDTLAAAAAPWDGTSNVSHPYIMDGVHLTTASSTIVGDTAFAAVDTLLDSNGAVIYYVPGAIDFSVTMPQIVPDAAIDFDITMPQTSAGAISFNITMPLAPPDPTDLPEWTEDTTDTTAWTEDTTPASVWTE